MTPRRTTDHRVPLRGAAELGQRRVHVGPVGVVPRHQRARDGHAATPAAARHPAQGPGRLRVRHSCSTAATWWRSRDPAAPASATRCGGLQQAGDAESSYAGLSDHPFATCFVCGTARAAGDGLRLLPGRYRPGRSACVWTPDASLVAGTTLGRGGGVRLGGAGLSGRLVVGPRAPPARARTDDGRLRPAAVDRRALRRRRRSCSVANGERLSPPQPCTTPTPTCWRGPSTSGSPSTPPASDPTPPANTRRPDFEVVRAPQSRGGAVVVPGRVAACTGETRAASCWRAQPR